MSVWYRYYTCFYLKISSLLNFLCFAASHPLVKFAFYFYSVTHSPHASFESYGTMFP